MGVSTDVGMSYDAGERRDTRLALKLKDRIRRDGPITVAEYMQACLHDPEHGYYRTRAAIGAAGDFITAPEISQVFGELIGLWCAVVWQQMGSPAKVNLVELGPGRGTLMRDALRAAKSVPEFLEAARLHLVETNDALRELQQQAIKMPADRHDSFMTLAADPTILVANEFLDTFPVNQLEFDERHFFLRGVGLDTNERLQFMRIGKPLLFASDLHTQWPEYHPGCIGENQDFRFMFELRRALKTAACAMLFVDYGHTAEKVGDTLQAVRKHRAEHPLASPGEADLTAQVDFEDFGSYASSELDASVPALAIDGPVTQAEFLGRLGIVERASRLMAANPAKAAEIEADIARLMAPNGMGTRFKAIGVHTAGLPTLPGF